MLQGEILVFCLNFVLLRGHLFASIEKVWFTFMKGNKLSSVALQRSICIAFTFLS